MGTSYYLYLKSHYEAVNNCFNDANKDEIFNIDAYELLSLIGIKIGKNSLGWKFCLHIYEYLNINSFDDWVSILKNDKYLIVDEYNEIISPNEMIDIISKKGRSFSKEETGKILDNQYIVSEVGLIEHRYPGFIVVPGKTYDYYICEKGY